MTNKNCPLISVIMPVYNAADFISEAIQSIINQTYKNWELIIVDDASTDNSWQIIKQFKDQYPDKIKAIKLKKNLNKGGDAAANIAIKMAKGKFIARMDADDISYPKRFERQVKYLNKHPRIFMVGSFVKVINGQGEEIGIKKLPLTNKKIKRECFVFYPFSHSSLMFRNILNKKRKFYMIKFSKNNDFYTFFTLLLKGYCVVNLPEVLVQYRVHLNNNSFKNVRESFLNTLKIRLIIMRKFHFYPNLYQILINFLQILIVFFLPQKISYYIYLLSKGIISKKDIWKKINTFFDIKLFKKPFFLSQRYKKRFFCYDNK